MSKLKSKHVVPCIEVRLNNGKPAVAGVSPGAVGMYFSWADAPESRVLDSPLGAVVITGVELGQEDEFRRWRRFRPKNGDTITIRFLASTVPDDPAARHRYNSRTKRWEELDAKRRG